jgi:LAO/AO transport system kinase
MNEDLVTGLLAGDQRSLARAITRVENREAGYREVVAACYRHAGDAHVVGVTGSPGAGKSTLVDHLVGAYRDREETVAVVAVDPSSPFSGGAVLGDRIRMGTTADPGVFVRSMSARGATGGLSAATADAVAALDAAGFEHVIVETVGAGQSEIEVVRTADTVAVLVPPSSGDDVQMLKAGILEIADAFVVNKADLDGADHTVRELRAMLERRESEDWDPPVVETVATTGEGVEELLDALAAHREHLAEGGHDRRVRERYAAAIRALLREDAGPVLERALDRRGGADALAREIADGETDPHEAVEAVLAPLVDCLKDK